MGEQRAAEIRDELVAALGALRNYASGPRPDPRVVAAGKAMRRASVYLDHVAIEKSRSARKAADPTPKLLSGDQTENRPAKITGKVRTEIQAAAARLARRTDPESSRLAASQFAAGAGEIRHASIILATLVRFGASTADEISDRCGLDHNQISRRLPEMERDGFIDRGEIRMARTSGRMEVTWRASKNNHLVDLEA